MNKQTLTLSVSAFLLLLATASSNCTDLLLRAQIAQDRVQADEMEAKSLAAAIELQNQFDREEQEAADFRYAQQLQDEMKDEELASVLQALAAQGLFDEYEEVLNQYLQAAPAAAAVPAHAPVVVQQDAQEDDQDNDECLVCLESKQDVLQDSGNNPASIATTQCCKKFICAKDLADVKNAGQPCPNCRSVNF